jgi:hypothetical protein
MNIEKRVTELVEEKIADMPHLFLVDAKCTLTVSYCVGRWG